MEKLIVLAGKARSGKDSVAEIIKEKSKNKKVLIYSCTTYLKKYIKQIYNWDGKENTKPREYLQNLGREIKETYPNFFLDRIEEDIKFLSNFCDIMIITGVRLEKELTFLKNKFNAILIKTERNINNNLSEKEKNDITETDVNNFNNFDYIIQNNDTLEKLKEKVENIMEEIK